MTATATVTARTPLQLAKPAKTDKIDRRVSRTTSEVTVALMNAKRQLPTDQYVGFLESISSYCRDELMEAMVEGVGEVGCEDESVLVGGGDDDALPIAF